MGYTVTELLVQAAKRYGDLNDGGTLGLTLAQQTHDDLCVRCRIAQTSRDVAITANSYVIALPTTVKRIWDVRLVRSAADGDSKQLQQVSKRWMDHYIRNWTNVTGGEPTHAIVEAKLDNTRALRIWRTPITGSSPTYPLIRIETTEKQTLKESSPGAGEIIVLPESVDDLRPYLEGIWWRFSRLYAPENEEKHKGNYDIAVNELTGRLKLFAGEDIPFLAPGWEQVGRPTT